MACLIWYGGGDDGSQVEDGDVDHGDVNSVGVTVDEDDCNDVAAAVVIILAQTVPKSGCDSEEYPASERRLSARRRACAMLAARARSGVSQAYWLLVSHGNGRRTRARGHGDDQAC